MLLALGEVQAQNFEGVNKEGWDVYRITFDKGTIEWSFVLGSDGKITGEWIRDLP